MEYRWSAVLALCFATSATAAEPASPKDVEFFESRIRPVLVERCYACHNSADTAEGGFVADHRSALLKGGDSGPVVVPGRPEKSRLLPILRHEVDGLKMPEDGPKLSAEVVADFEKWIAAGAPDPRTDPPSPEEIEQATSWEAVRERRKRWWSFQPITSSPVPAVENGDWSDHPVDHFVLAKLEERDLRPSEPADPATLVRRLHYTLIGLPPAPEAVERWTARLAVEGDDERDVAVTDLVDELLGSPHFAERWARHWMDWTRYAESHGSEGDPEIVGAWQYRDYLIRALEADVPYDQLVREHVAGDLLEEPRIDADRGVDESLIGTAHWRMVFHGFAPTDALDERVRFTDDQIDAFSKAFLGLTVSCARCHDHKFDAISQRDYYALFGILRSYRPGRSAIETVERQSTNIDELAALKPRIRTALATSWLDSLEGVRTTVLESVPPTKPAGQPNSPLGEVHAIRRELGEEPTDAEFAKAWQRRAQALATSKAARPENESSPQHHWSLADSDDYAEWSRTGIGLSDPPSRAGEFTIPPEGERAIQNVLPAGVYSHRLSSKHADRLTSPDVPLDGAYELWVHATGADGATVRYAVHDYPRSGTVYPVTKLGAWRWQRYDLSYWDGDTIHVELTTAADAPLLARNTPRSWFGVRRVVVRPKGAGRPLDDPREGLEPLFTTDAEQSPRSYDQLADRVRDALKVAISRWRAGKATDADALFLTAALDDGLLQSRLDRLPDVAPLVAEYRRLEAEVPVPTRVPTLEETSGRVQRVFERGNHRRPGEEVPHRFLEAIDDTPYIGEGSGRRQLAEDLLREDNPFVRRVIVNRLWHHLFGEGLVRTPDNLGRLGEQPSHPELLDWLAVRFARDGWSLKKTIRLIVTSRTWQQTARPSPGAKELDPDNRLLSHAHVRRLEAEAIRDGLLTVTGELDRNRFGPPVDGNSRRRSLYVRVRRNRLDPMLRTFDFPEPFSTTGRRDVTNVPAQSLLWMNDQRVHALAAAWARRVLEDESFKTDEERVRSMFVAAFGRSPLAGEVVRVIRFLRAAESFDAEAIARAAMIRSRIDSERESASAILAPVRAKLLEQRGTERPRDLPSPIAVWNFDDDARDSIGTAHGKLVGGARLEGGALVLDGRGAYVVTDPIGRELREKTLEAWVRLGGIEQRGGGVISIQTPNGVEFDGIVFGEKDPGQWLAGSNFFRRTQSLGGPQEAEARESTVHVAMVYRADGEIQAFRNGLRYGKPYRSSGPVAFAKSAVVTIGLRHLPAGGNKHLAGRIEHAQLHDRALGVEEVAASARARGGFVSDREIRTELPAAARREYDARIATIRRLERELRELGSVPPNAGPARAWTKLALSLFALKEFTYLR